MKTLLLDHLAVSGTDRDTARAHIEEALGLPMQTGGEHAKFATHNHLMGMGCGLYLEAISIDPNVPNPDRARWFNLDNFSGTPRLTNWICAVPDMAAALERWEDVGTAVSLERGELRWQMAVPRSGILPFDGFFPPLIQWHGALHPNQMLGSSGVSLKQLTVAHPQADALSATLGTISGALIRFETAQNAALFAEFVTPHGPRTLT